MFFASSKKRKRFNFYYCLQKSQVTKVEEEAELSGQARLLACYLFFRRRNLILRMFGSLFLCDLLIRGNVETSRSHAIYSESKLLPTRMRRQQKIVGFEK
jgi:hypothetical protein